jgi:hypothetical protein
VATQKLGAFWDYDYDFYNDYEGGAGGQTPIWESYFVVGELHRAANAKVLTGTGQARLVTLADWAAQMPVRYVNEAVGGSFRQHRYQTTISRSATSVDQPATWGEMWTWTYGSNTTPVAGPWVVGPDDSSVWPPAATNGSSYDVHFWAAFVAGIERSVPGADAAWTKVLTNVTNLSNWSEGFTTDPRFGPYPRNK